jgi:hypothetical protein
MRIPESEIPDMRKLAAWARENLPVHYDLVDIRCDYVSDMPAVIPEDFEIVIEYRDRLDPSQIGSPAAIEAHRAWSGPLTDRIRAEWPPSTIRIAFKGREAPHG